MSNLSLSGPVDVSDNFVGVISRACLRRDHGSEESCGEFFSAVDGELVDAHLVGLSVVGVVLVDEDEVLLKDQSPVCFLLRCPVGSVLALPLSEGVNLALVGRVVDCQDGNRDK